jgi:DNA-binding CsgD family transcriptional regulator
VALIWRSTEGPLGLQPALSEREPRTLIAQGATNAEITARLVLNRNTVWLKPRILVWPR